MEAPEEEFKHLVISSQLDKTLESYTDVQNVGAFYGMMYVQSMVMFKVKKI